MSALQKKINALMLQKNITAVDIEKATGLSRNTIYSILSGHSKSPSVHNIQLIARVLGVTLDSLLSDGQQTVRNLSFDEMKDFLSISSIAISMLEKYRIALNIDQLTKLVNTTYKYASKSNPPTLNEEFFIWLLENSEIR